MEKTLSVGIDLSKVTDRWTQLAYILKAEPYLERMASDNPKAELKLHYTSPEPVPPNVIFELLGPEATIRNIAWHPSVEEMNPEIAFEFSTALDANYVNRPFRATPCLGKQDWFQTTQRPKSLVFVLAENDSPTLNGFDQDTTTVYDAWDDMWHIVQDIRKADMVVTDHCGVALLAAAASVNRVTCLEMLGDPDLLEGIGAIKRFKRRSGDEAAQYDALLKFAYHEWSGYERYPTKLLNEGDAQRFIQPLALQYCRGFGIDVGSNHWPFPGAIRCDIENRVEAWRQAPFDFVFSSHCLEHIKTWETELKIWHDSLKPDGIMFCYVPHPLCEVWLPEGDWVRGGWHVWSPDPITLYRHVRFELGMEVLQYSSRPDPYWGFHLIARKK